MLPEAVLQCSRVTAPLYEQQLSIGVSKLNKPAVSLFMQNKGSSGMCMLPEAVLQSSAVGSLHFHVNRNSQ